MNDRTAHKYWQCSNESEDLTMIEWLRLFDTNKAHPKAYKQGSTIVGAKTVSLMNKEDFLQFVLLHFAHRNFNSLCHPNHEQLPDQLQWFAAAVHHFPQLWTRDEKIKSWLLTQGHRDCYITGVLSYIASLRDIFYLVRSEVISNEQLQVAQQHSQTSFVLDSYQSVVANHIDKAVRSRHEFYVDTFRNRQQCMTDSDDSGSESDESHNARNNTQMQHREHQRAQNILDINMTATHVPDIQWENPIVITGKPGAGKSETISQCVSKYVQRDQSILVAAPTSFLASRFRAILPDEVICVVRLLRSKQFTLHFTYQ